jgi:Ca2+-transporting ATPase
MIDLERIYSLPPEQVADALASNLVSGLSEVEARRRLAETGPNELQQAKVTSPGQIFLAQFKDFIIWVLIGAALVSGFLREWIDAIAIVAIVVLNAILGFVQEYRAEKSLAALKRLTSPTSKVIRNGQHNVMPARELVAGDLIELEAGDHIPADGRLVWITSNFSTQEACLTGESTPVIKTTRALDEKEVALADRANMVYTGTSVASGRARVLVSETGMSSELGRIAGMIQEIQHETTPLQRKLEEFGKWIVYLCFGLVGLVFLLEWLRGGRLMDVFLTAVSLAVAAIPEGLPAVVTIALALGVQRMVKRHALIRKLPSVETLGCATVICSDKTGTLTKNEMTVQAALADGRIFKVTGIGYEPEGEITLDGRAVSVADLPGLQRTLECAVLCNGAHLAGEPGRYKIFGDPTEAALLTAAAKAGIWKEPLEAQFAFVDEIPFDSERKKMTVVRRSGVRLVSYVKGAPDVLVADCSRIDTGGRTRPLTSEDREQILAANSQFADQAMRVLGFAYKDIGDVPPPYDTGSVETGLVFVGLMAMIDPPRPEVKLAVGQCQKAGIRAVMITGDHKNTAAAIARELGLFAPGSVAVTGDELDALPAAEFSEEIERIPVYARVSPEHKLRIVKALREKGHVVAMTGDGVNDAPAVKEADIGVAMGITGTDVTKEVSDMVVTDDNFASIVAAVEEGRGIYDNIRKFVHYLLSCNTGEVLVMFVASLVGMPVPLLPVQILWVNLITDGLPALALGMEPMDPGVMERPPRKRNEPVITRQRAVLILTQGAFIATCSLLAFALVYFVEGEGLARARTAAFIVLACSQLVHSFNCRSMTRSIFDLGLFTNFKLVLATGLSFLLQIGVVYLPFAQVIFKTQPLTLLDWAIVLAISSFPLWAMEVVKLVLRRTNRQHLLPA